MSRYKNLNSFASFSVNLRVENLQQSNPVDQWVKKVNCFNNLCSFSDFTRFFTSNAFFQLSLSVA